MAETNTKLESNYVKMDDLGKKLNVVMDKVLSRYHGILESTPMDGPHGETSNKRA